MNEINYFHWMKITKYKSYIYYNISVILKYAKYYMIMCVCKIQQYMPKNDIYQLHDIHCARGAKYEGAIGLSSSCNYPFTKNI